MKIKFNQHPFNQRQLQKTLEYLVDTFRQFAEIDKDTLDLPVEAVSISLRMQARHAKGSIFGIKILLIDSGFSDPDVTDRYTDQIRKIEKNAIKTFKAMKEKQEHEKSGGLPGGHSFDDPAKGPALDSGQIGN